MTTIEVMHDEPLEEPVEEPERDAVEEPTGDVFKEYQGLTVKQLSKSQRSKVIEDFEKGVDNPYFKVNRLKNGTYRVNKRSTPLSSEPSEAVARANERIEKRTAGMRLTTEQLLLEHMFELERRLEGMRMKHKKLKKRYNKLESDIFSDDEEPSAVPLNALPDALEDVETTEKEVEIQYNTPVQEQPAHAISAYRRPVKRSWRTMLNA